MLYLLRRARGSGGFGGEFRGGMAVEIHTRTQAPNIEQWRIVELLDADSENRLYYKSRKRGQL